MTVVARAVVNVAAVTLSPALVHIGEQEEVNYSLFRGTVDLPGLSLLC